MAETYSFPSFAFSLVMPLGLRLGWWTRPISFIRPVVGPAVPLLRRQGRVGTAGGDGAAGGNDLLPRVPASTG